MKQDGTLDFNEMQLVTKRLLRQIENAPDENAKRAILEKLIERTSKDFQSALWFAIEMTPDIKQEG